MHPTRRESGAQYTGKPRLVKPCSAPSGAADPIRDALHHVALDAEITVRRQRLASLGLDLVALDVNDLLARRAGERGENLRREAGAGDRAAIATISDDEGRH